MAMYEPCSVMLLLAKARDTRTMSFSLAAANVTKALKRVFPLILLSFALRGTAVLEGRASSEGYEWGFALRGGVGTGWGGCWRRDVACSAGGGGSVAWVWGSISAVSMTSAAVFRAFLFLVPEEASVLFKEQPVFFWTLWFFTNWWRWHWCRRDFHIEDGITIFIKQRTRDYNTFRIFPHWSNLRWKIMGTSRVYLLWKAILQSAQTTVLACWIRCNELKSKREKRTALHLNLMDSQSGWF